ncbi:ribosome recycling factor [Candidatus Microgenomates bacterium]|nr:ribosome recycling factor [Candidatus Microgenomates bacterium]
MEEILKSAKEKFAKAIEFFENEIRSVRTGRANAILVEDIRLDIYGQSMRVKEVASITVPDAMSIVINPWDRNNVKNIEDALRAANLGVGVVNMGENIRVTLPELSAERREELKKTISKKAEETKVALRNIRREAIDQGKKLKDSLGEDIVERLEKEIQKLLDEKTKEIDVIVEKKEKEISL